MWEKDGSAKVYLRLAIVLPSGWKGSPLFNLCGKLDVFSLWMVALLVIALPLATGISKKKAVLTIGYLWGVWLLASMFLSGLVRIS